MRAATGCILRRVITVQASVGRSRYGPCVCPRRACGGRADTPTGVPAGAPAGVPADVLCRASGQELALHLGVQTIAKCPPALAESLPEGLNVTLSAD